MSIRPSGPGDRTASPTFVERHSLGLLPHGSTERLAEWLQAHARLELSKETQSGVNCELTGNPKYRSRLNPRQQGRCPYAARAFCRRADRLGVLAKEARTMHRASSQLRSLQNNDCVAIIGGGPAGSFFAIHLLREARRLNRRIDVVIVEKRGPIELGPDGCQSKGCSFCAGSISPRLNETLKEHDLVVPDEIIQGRFDYVWIQGQWKNFRLRVPKGMEMYSVFRGSLPSRRSGRLGGFDGFLLGEAVKEGSRILYGEVDAIAYTATGMPSLTVRTPSGERVSVDASFVCIATGINAHCGSDYRDDTLIASVRRLNPAFVPGKSRQTFIFELDVGEDYLEHNLRREVYFIEYGSKRLALEHAALVPKGRFLTIAMIGKCVDEAVLPRDSQKIVHDFLRLPQIDRILPGIEAAPLACACAPRMTVTAARSPYGDRFAVIGDAVGSRLNKDGLFSAHATASRLAQTVLHEGVGKQALAKGYGKAIKWLSTDNRFGRMVFGMSRVAFTRPVVSRVMYQAFATECKVRDERSRPLSVVLWKIASGTADYREVLGEMCSYGVLRSILVGAAVTLRNVAFELLFGLKWGEYGRYPTVVLKEKREAVKERLASSLGTKLGEWPDFERMYVIKIRGSGEEIIEELAKFGQPNAQFLNLRFVEVRRTQGVPNQVGSVIRYRIPLVGLGAELRLTKRVGFETLLYQFDERLVDHGKLIFNVAPTKDGNSKLTIYTAFDYKKGNGVAGRVLWEVARFLFPGFVHDVVWNHALCTIKEEVERKYDYTPRR
jgi:flavin-dependent dehydrogenase